MSDIVVCPNCGNRFSKAYSRITMCKNCPESINRCVNVKCPKCGHDFSEYDRKI